MLLSVEDTEDRAKLRLAKGVERVKDLLQPVVSDISCHKCRKLCIFFVQPELSSGVSLRIFFFCIAGTCALRKLIIGNTPLLHLIILSGCDVITIAIHGIFSGYMSTLFYYNHLFFFFVNNLPTQTFI